MGTPAMKRETTGKNREGRWVRVHGIARRTIFDTMLDEQPFCQDVTERRRTTVRFLRQQSEMTIDDTWPQAGEMRSLWKGTTELWTHDMPQDDTWKPNRHHSNILQLFRNHLTRNAVAMFPLPPNPVASTEHGCRDSHLPAVPHTEDAEEKRETRGFGGGQNYPTCTAPTTTTPPVPQSLKTLLLKQQILVKPWGEWHGKWKHVSAAIINDKGEITGTSKSIQRKLVTDGKRHSSRTVEGRTDLDLVQDEVEEAKRLLEEAHVEVQAAQNKVTEAAFRVGQAMEEMAQIR